MPFDDLVDYIGNKNLPSNLYGFAEFWSVDMLSQILP